MFLVARKEMRLLCLGALDEVAPNRSNLEVRWILQGRNGAILIRHEINFKDHFVYTLTSTFTYFDHLKHRSHVVHSKEIVE